MSKVMVKERSGFRELLRNFFSSDYEEEQIFEGATADEKKAWKAALANSDKIMGEVDKTAKSGKKAGKKIVETVEVSKPIEKKQPTMNKKEDGKEMEIGE